MRYAVVQVVNGNFSVVSEHGENLDGARVKFHDVCKNLWAASDVNTARVAVVGDDFAYVDGHIEEISHAQPDPEPVTEQSLRR